MKQSIGTRVKFTRKLKDISQAELARKIGLTKGAISQLEKGLIKSTAINIGKIARALHVSTDYLIFGEEAKENSNLYKQVLTKLLLNEKFKQIIVLLEDPEVNDLLETILKRIKEQGS